MPGRPSPNRDTPLICSKGVVVQPQSGSNEPNANDKFDDEDYPAYSMGSAARILDTTPAFLRSLDEAKLLTPQRSDGGHRRYSRYQLRIAARVPVSSSIRGPRWKRPAGSSFSRTSSPRRTPSTPHYSSA